MRPESNIMFVPVNRPKLDGNEKKYLNECIDTGWISSDGPFVKKFEEKMSNALDREFGVAVSNGSVALELALQALDLKAGGEVIVPSFTIISCGNAIIKSGLKPIFIDCSKDDLNSTPKMIEDAISSKTVAIMVVHLYGHPCDMDKIESIAKNYNLKLIEDAAEMHGQYYKDRPCGSFGDVSTLSFYPNKHVTTGEGGMVLTNNKDLMEKIRFYMNLCFGKGDSRYLHYDIGSNYRFTNLQAAVGLAQVESLKKTVLRKREIGSLYNKGLSNIDYLKTPIEFLEYSENIYWVYPITINGDINFVKSFKSYLEDSGIGHRSFFTPLHLQPCYKNIIDQNNILPNCEELYKFGLYIPCGNGITDEEVDYVIKKIKKFNFK